MKKIQNMFSEEHLYSIALRKCSQIGDITFRRLVATLGSAESVWKESPGILAKISGVRRDIFQDIGSAGPLVFADQELRFCEKNGIEILLRHQHQLPYFLNECDDAPAILYRKGTYTPNLSPVSMVGTRKMTPYGKTFIEEFLQAVAENMIITVSGLAHGVDTQVHQSSLDNRIPTIAVLAHGFHRIYPAVNRRLAHNILENGGALYTEFNSSDEPDREHFLQRNRIIAGISRKLIVVETAFGGGSMSTATYANSYNRDVYALPGKITDKYSQGSNQLIFQNKAAAISTIGGLVNMLDLQRPKPKMEELFPRSEIRIHLTEEQDLIYQIILKKPNITIDELAEKSGMPTFKILPIILDLEMSQYIRSLSGRQFSVL